MLNGGVYSHTIYFITCNERNQLQYHPQFCSVSTSEVQWR